MTSLDPYFIPIYPPDQEEEKHICAVTGESLPEQDLYYNEYPGEWLRKDKIEEYLDLLGLSDEERNNLKQIIIHENHKS